MGTESWVFFFAKILTARIEFPDRHFQGQFHRRKDGRFTQKWEFWVRFLCFSSLTLVSTDARRKKAQQTDIVLLAEPSRLGKLVSRCSWMECNCQFLVLLFRRVLGRKKIHARKVVVSLQTRTRQEATHKMQSSNSYLLFFGLSFLCFFLLFRFTFFRFALLALLLWTGLWFLLDKMQGFKKNSKTKKPCERNVWKNCARMQNVIIYSITLEKIKKLCGDFLNRKWT